jgi:YesN/AraC family two-component response regulator
MNARLRVVIADDERPARSFLAAPLRSFEDIVIVAEAESGADAVAAIERERPDPVLLVCTCRSLTVLASCGC